MTTGRRLERDLPLILDELAASPYPDYIDSVLTTTARRRQRPTWTFPERWLPMTAVTSRARPAPRIPLRAIALVALLLIAMAVGALLLAGSQQRRLPAPFGPAQNGLITYSAGGDIYTVDPATGKSTAIVTGPETDINPRWSRDGTRLAFERKVTGDSGPGLLYVARADGSDLVRLKTPSPLASIASYEFSPDGTELLVSYEVDTYGRALIAAADGSSFRPITTGMPILTATWRPPLGSEILVMDADDGTAKNASGAMSLVSAESGLPIQTILERIYARWRGHPMWSPDGSLISFGEWGDGDPDNGGLTVQTHVIATDGSVNRVLPAATGVQWQAPESWSNDGTRLLVIRGYAPDHSGARPVAIPVDGSGTGVEVDWPSTTMSPTDAFAWEWAPDDSSILGTPANDDGGYLDQVLLDPVAGTSRTLAWSSNSLPSWQRKAP